MNLIKFTHMVEQAMELQRQHPEAKVSINISQSLAQDEEVSKLVGLNGTSTDSHGYYREFTVNVVPDIYLRAFNAEGEIKL